MVPKQHWFPAEIMRQYLFPMLRWNSNPMLDFWKKNPTFPVFGLEYCGNVGFQETSQFQDCPNMLKYNAAISGQHHPNIWNIKSINYTIFQGWRNIAVNNAAISRQVASILRHCCLEYSHKFGNLYKGCIWFSIYCGEVASGNLTTINEKPNATLIQVSKVVGIFKTTMPQCRGNIIAIYQIKNATFIHNTC